MKTNFAQTKCAIILLTMMTVIPGLATAASRATAAADRDPRSASSGSAVVKANAFLTVDGDHVRVAEDGSIVYDRDAAGSFTVTARSGWLVEGREMLTLPYSAERPRALKVTGLTGEDGAEVPVSPVIQKSFLNKPVGFYPEDGHLQITALSGVPGRLVYPDIDHLRLPDDGRVDYLKADCDFIRNFDVSFDQLVDGLKYCNKLNEECLMSKIEYDADDHNCVSVMLEMANACGVLTEEETNRLNASFWAPGKLAAEWMK